MTAGTQAPPAGIVLHLLIPLPARVGPTAAPVLMWQPYRPGNSPRFTSCRAARRSARRILRANLARGARIYVGGELAESWGIDPVSGEPVRLPADY